MIIDPIGSYLGGGVDAHRDNEVRAILQPIATLAKDFGVAVLIVCHNRKGAAQFADDTTLGSRAFIGIARSSLHLSEDETNRQRKLLLPGKTNLTDTPPGLAFRIVGDPPRIEWEPDSLEGLHADDVMTPSGGSPRGPKPTNRNEAVAWLQELLALGPMPTVEIKTQSKEAGFSWATVTRAKDELKIQPTKQAFSGGWLWQLPTGEVTHVPSKE